MASEADYRALNDRIRKLDQTRAVLQAQEQIKGEKREQLMKELVAEGINVEDLTGEAARLQQEIDADYAKAQELVSGFEKSLAAVQVTEEN